MKTINKSIKKTSLRIVSFISCAFLLTPLCSFRNTAVTDDTATLQAMLKAGDVTLPAGQSYHITSLTVTHNLNLNGSVLNMTGTTGAGLRITAPGITVTNGKILGTWVTTSASNPNGTTGLVVSDHCDNVILSKLTVSNTSAYGMFAGAVNNISVNKCMIEKTGYIGFYYDAESIATTTGTFTDNTIDRSMIAPGSVHQIAVAIRGSVNNGNKTSNWKVGGNTIRMPKLPTDWSAACIELRNVNTCNFYSNHLNGGSIGVSVVVSSGVKIQNNHANNAQLEGIEFADSNNCQTSKNLINGSAQAGILVDGSTGCNNIVLNGDTVENTTQECIHGYMNTSNLSVTNCVLIAKYRGINLQHSTAVTVTNTSMDGLGTGDCAIVIDSCPGNFKMTGGSIKNFKKCSLSIFSNVAGMTTDNISMTGVTVANTPNPLLSVLQNGALLGKNIVIKN